MSSLQPPLFVSHGAPDLVLKDIPAARFLRGLFKNRLAPEGIVIVSAHWQTSDLTITTAPNLETIYDFGGFQRELYQMVYPARTADWLGKKVAAKFVASGVEFREDPRRGLDHGAWAPLHLMFPDASIPVVQLSLPRRITPTALFELGEQLAPLSEENILIIGSGASVHNLWRLQPEGAPAPEWAIAFDAWIDRVLSDRDWHALCRFEDTAHSALAHPTPEHFLPLIFAAGVGQLRSDTVVARHLHHSFSYGSIGMSSWEFVHET